MQDEKARFKFKFLSRLQYPPVFTGINTLYPKTKMTPPFHSLHALVSYFPTSPLFHANLGMLEGSFCGLNIIRGNLEGMCCFITFTDFKNIFYHHDLIQLNQTCTTKVIMALNFVELYSLNLI